MLEPRRSFPSESTAILQAIGGGLIAASGIVVVGAWLLHAEYIVRIEPSFPAMRFNTALAIVCTGASLIALGFGRRVSGHCAIGIAAMLGLAALLENYFGIDLNIDQLLVRDTISLPQERPGLMAPATGMSFVLLALAVIALYRDRPLLYVGTSAAIIASSQAVGVLLFFLIGVDAAHRPTAYTGMALHTAMLVALSGVLVLLGQPLAVSERGRRYLPVTAAIGSLALTLVLWWGLRVQQTESLTNLLELQANSFSAQIDSEIQARASALMRMRRRWEKSANPEKEAWQFDAAGYLDTIPGLVRLEWIDETNTLRWEQASAPGGAISKASITCPDNMRADSARKRSYDTVSGATLSFQDGSPGFYMIVPLHTGSRSDGCFRALWDTRRLLSSFLQPQRATGYAISLSDNGNSIFDSGESAAADSPVVSHSFYLDGIEWRLRVAAAPALLAKLRSRTATATLVGGILLSTLLSGTIHFLLLARSQREEMVTAEKRFQLLVSAVRDYAIYMLDPGGRVMTWNAGAERTKGWRSNEIIGQHFSLFFPPEDVASGRPQRLLQSAAVNGGVSEESWRMRKDGSRFWASVVVTPLLDSQGTLIGYSKVVRDLTERQAHEMALQTTLAFQSAILRSAHLAIVATDQNGVIRSFNPAAERMLGYRSQEMVGLRTPEVFHDSAEVRDRAISLSSELQRRIEPGFEVFVAKARTADAEEREWTFVRKDGSRFPVLLSVTALRAEDGAIHGYLGLANDITARKRDEEQIREALREKEVLLKEVYHRVKNNLQVIQSLLSLQRRAVPEGIARGVIDDAAQRVRAMALVHEKLYQSANLSAVSLPEYVRDLCQQIVAAMGMDTRAIEVHIDVSPVEAGIDTAVPLGLLLTELVSNSFKHAFPAGRRSGRVDISISNDETGTVLTVADNGIGLPPDFNPGTAASLGIKLAASLARQLGGELEISSSAGARFSLRMPKFAQTLEPPYGRQGFSYTAASR